MKMKSKKLYKKATVEKNGPSMNRRKFLNDSVKTAVGTGLALSFPSIVPASVFGKSAPSNRINVAAIGVGRISRGHDMPGVWKHDFARVMAVCDVDSRRALDGKQLVNEYYSRKEGKPFDGVKVYSDYRELL